MTETRHQVGAYTTDDNDGVRFECDDCGWSVTVLDSQSVNDLESATDQVTEHEAGVS